MIVVLHYYIIGRPVVKISYWSPAMYRDPVPMKKCKNIAMIAHDNRKADLLEWARYNQKTLAKHNLYATGTTGGILTR